MNGEPFVTCVILTLLMLWMELIHLVRSEDNAGNKDSTPASFTWSVDTTPYNVYNLCCRR